MDWPGSPEAWVLRFLSEVGVRVEVLREAGDRSLVGGLMDDVAVVPASLSGRFSALRSTQNQHRLRGGAATRSGRGNR
ncbi:hypothetical protein FXW78_50805 [Rhodococcus opacus]|nr:hypothetical protein [Rhodococcus opacus]RZL82416.1 MAG: hypothetical protein EOP32_11610 [Rhodococcus sp. (in: high G+C Gram-positive bacteria)]